MTAYDFSLVSGTVNFNVAGGDSLNIPGVDAADITVTSVTGGVQITANGKTVTFNGLTAAQITTNIVTFGTDTDRSLLVVGDNDTGNTLDGIANTIDIPTDFAASADADHLVYGLGGGDSITVGNGANLIYGGTGGADSTDGGDTITIGTGANRVFGNAGNDSVISAGATAAGTTNTIYLGLGNDTADLDAAAGAGDYVVYGNTGDDSVDIDTTGNVTVFGGNGIADSSDGADTLLFTNGGVTAYGNSGNDSITGGATASGKAFNVFAGTGNDTITSTGALAGSTAALYGNTGDDSITSNSAGTTTIYGGNGIADSTDGNDTIVASNTGNFTIYANSGNDTVSVDGLNGATDVGTIFSGTGDDTVSVDVVDGAQITLATGPGSDVVNYVGNNNGAARLTVSDFDGANDVVNVTLSGGDASDFVFSGGLLLRDADADNQYDSGEDFILFSNLNSDFNSSNLVINGGSRFVSNIFATAAATLTGSAGNDYLLSGDLGDTLVSAGGDDKMDGAGGNDTFQVTNAGLTNADTIIGGNGTDTIELTAADGALVDADFGAGLVTSIEGLKLANVDFTGNGITLAGLAVDAGIRSVDGSAQTTGTSDALVTLAAGWDATTFTFTGGAGADTVDASANAAGENVTLTGGAGADSLVGGAGADSITGDADADTVTGGAGNDTLSGGAAADEINGGAGVDSLSGGDAADVFFFAATESGETTSTVDRITDLNLDADSIDFGGVIDLVVTATGTDYTTGNATLVAAATAAATAHYGTAADNSSETAVLFTYSGQTYLLLQGDDTDANYTTADDVLINVTGFTGTLTAGDFA